MKPARPFKVINCLSQGFAVAGPVLADGHQGKAPRVDLEMIQWGMAADKAEALADKLNKANSGGHTLPQHRRD